MRVILCPCLIEINCPILIILYFSTKSSECSPNPSRICTPFQDSCSIYTIFEIFGESLNKIMDLKWKFSGFRGGSKNLGMPKIAFLKITKFLQNLFNFFEGFRRINLFFWQEKCCSFRKMDSFSNTLNRFQICNSARSEHLTVQFKVQLQTRSIPPAWIILFGSPAAPFEVGRGLD